MIHNADTAGGVIITRRVIPYERPGEKFGIFAQSDHHIGAHDSNYELMAEELAEAKERGDRILLNGDLFDCILPSDSKRFTPDTLHPRIRGRRDILNAAVEMALEIFAPYADNIDVIGSGNHEGSVEKHHSVDPVMWLLDSLAAHCSSGHEIAYGGKMGFLQYKFTKNGGAGETYTIFYFHGAGGSAPVTKGMIDFNRLSTWVDADAILTAHKHNRWSDTTPQRMSCPQSGDEPVLRDVIHIMTGGYRRAGLGQSQAAIKAGGKQTPYATEFGLAPQKNGGARLILTIRPKSRAGISTRVTQ